MITEMGTSAVIIHSKQGQEFFEYVKEELKYVKSKPESISFWNTCLEKSVEYNPSREVFFDNYENTSIKEIIRALDKATKERPANDSFTKKVFAKTKRILKLGLKKLK